MKKRIILTSIILLILLCIPCITLSKNSINNKVKKYLDGTPRQLATPGYIYLTDDLIASWEEIPECDNYEMIVYMDNQSLTIEVSKTETNLNPYGQVVDGVFTADITSAIYSTYKFHKSELAQSNLSVKIAVTARTLNENEYMNSDLSEESNTISFTPIIIKENLSTPTNVSLTDNLIASWEEVPECDYYEMIVYMDDQQQSISVLKTQNNLAPYGYVENGVFTADITNAVNSTYLLHKSELSKSNLSVKIAVAAYTFNTDEYINSDLSQESNTITFTPTVKEKLASPTNVSLSNNYIASWDAVQNANEYYIAITIGEFPTEFPATNFTVTKNNNRISTDLTQSIENSISLYQTIYGTGNPIIKIKVRALSEENSEYDMSDYSEFSNFIVYGNNVEVPVESFNISPNSLFLALDKYYQLDIDIQPENATYDKIDWMVENDKVILYNDGLIKGNATGTTHIGAYVNGIPSGSKEITVYLIDSNIENETTKQIVIDKANAVIEDITANKNNALAAGTDIEEGNDISRVLDEIYAINYQNITNKFYVELSIYDPFDEERYEEEYAKHIPTIQSKYGNNTNIAEIYDTSIIIDKMSGGNRRIICHITELDQNIDVSMPVPSNLPAIPTGKIRKYSLIKYQNNSYTKVPITVTGENILISTKDFSNNIDYILTYEDVDLEFTQPKKNITNDSTKNITTLLSIESSFDPELTEWTSSNPEVASIDEYGNITTHSTGTTTITVKIGDQVKTIDIEVINQKIGDMSGNGSVDASDVVLTLKKLFKYSISTEDEVKISDINGNEKLDVSDITSMLKYVFRYIDEL